MSDILHTPRKTIDPVVRLRGLLRRKTTEKQRFQKEMEQLDQSMGPLREAAREHEEANREVHARFQQAMTKPGLSKAKRTLVRELYEELLLDGVLSPLPDDMATEDDCPCPACTAARARAARGDEGAASAAEGDAGDFDGARSGSPFEGRRAEGMPPDHAAAKKPERDKGLRALYHKLAQRYHPDRAEDDEERAEHGDVMRQVNDAYHSGDTQRLLELSHELGVDVEGLAGGTGLLQELTRQYENLKAELRELRASFLGMLVVDTRRAARAGTEAPLDMLLEHEVTMRDEVRRIRDFVGEFVEGRISVETLMEGPPREDAEDFGDLTGLGSLSDFEGLEDVDPDDIDLLRQVLRRGPQVIGLDDILDALGEALRSAASPAPRGARAGAKGKKKKKKKRPQKRR